MGYAFSLAIIICGIALTGLRAVIDMTSTPQFHFDLRVLLLLVAGGLLLRQQWARLAAMALSALASLSIFYVGVRGTLNANQLHIQALWFESTNASVLVLWLICAAMIGYFFWSYYLLSCKRTQTYFSR